MPIHCVVSLSAKDLPPKQQGRHTLFHARTLLGAPGIATRSKGLTTRNKKLETRIEEIN